MPQHMQLQKRLEGSVQVKMTLLLTIVAVPINTVVGITAAINITRNEFPGKTLLIAMLDLPFSISPVVTGSVTLLSRCPSCRGLYLPIRQAQKT